MFLLANAIPTAMFVQDGNTALHFAAEKGDEEMTRLLLAVSASPNAVRAVRSGSFTPRSRISHRTAICPDHLAESLIVRVDATANVVQWHSV